MSDYPQKLVGQEENFHLSIDPMGVDELLEIANELIAESTGRPLSTLETKIFRGSWNGDTYEKIAEPTKYSVSHVKDQGAKLWELLSTVLPKRVTKTNFQVVLELEYKQRSLSQSTLPQPHLYKAPDAPLVKKIQLPELGSNFVGRVSAIADLDDLIAKNSRIVLVHSRGGEGKTTLAKQYLKCRFGDRLLEFIIAKEPKNISSVESLLEERLKQLGEEPGREFGISLDRLKHKLKAEPIGVLIDNLESALDGNGQFIEPHRRYVELLRVLADSEVQSLTLITSRDRIREPAVEVESYFLKGLSVGAWHEFFQSRGVSVEAESATLEKMHQAYSGNAKAMTLLCGAVQKDYRGNIDSYWSDVDGDLLSNGELRNLIAEQFNRLQTCSPAAYNLLIRMGCYRYQDVQTIPKEGVTCLLWDISRGQYKRVIQSLRDQALVEFEDGKYWLHPEVRAEAVSRLRPSEDWILSNEKAAEFWTSNVASVEVTLDAIRALEAYHHYIEISMFDQAGWVLVNERSNQCASDENLGISFYRLGLLNQMIHIIHAVKPKLLNGYSLSRLCNILGDLYWMTGNLSRAILYHKESAKVAHICLQSESSQRLRKQFMSLICVSFFNRGLCKLDLGDLNLSRRFFERSISIAQGLPEDLRSKWRYIAQSSYCIAFIQSLSSNIENISRASTILRETFACTEELRTTYDNAWSTGYHFLFLGGAHKNLKNLKESSFYFTEAIKFAEKSHYPQVKAKALTGLAEIYRKQEDFKAALSHHFQSTELLDKLGAKCDLAEAYFQLGLTYQTTGDTKKSREYFDKAIRIYEEIQAPRQIERVRQAVETPET